MRAITTVALLVGFNQLCLAQCLPPTAFEYLDGNNAKVGIRNGGDLWWTGSNSAYEIPTDSGRHCWFNGALWIGGLDSNGSLHLTTTTYGSNSYGFSPGPLNADGETDPYDCADADRIFKLNRHEVEQFRVLFSQPEYIIPEDILQWPATGNPHAEFIAEAPFVDVNNDQVYNPQDGDYPAFSFDGFTNIDNDLLGDQCLWWVMNDNGGAIGPNGSNPFGVQIQCMAYAFNTCDELNDQTFYRYTITNKSSESYHDVVLGIWGDPDLGYYDDDFVGCDVMRSIGFVYNGDSLDWHTGSGPAAYPNNPPASGIDILRGPLADNNDGIDNDRDGTIDEMNEYLALSNFSSFQNGSLFPPPIAGLGDPYDAQDYYLNLNGIWKDGTPMCYGGLGHPVAGCNGVQADFMYPGDSDPQGYGTGMVPQSLWSEETSNNVPRDRRMLLSVGPFSLTSGETELLHFATLFAWDQFGPEPYSSVEQLKSVSDVVQLKFDTAFQNTGCCEPVAEIGIQQFEIFTYVFSPMSSGHSYSWDFGDGTTSTDPYPIHEYDDHGTYEVCLVVTNDCGTDELCEFITIAPAPQSVILKRIEGQGNGNRILDFTDDVHDVVLNASNHRIDHPTYYFNRGPVRVEVIDESLVPAGDIAIRLNGVEEESTWKMYVIGGTDTIYSNSTIEVGLAQLVPDWGLLIQVKQTGMWDNVSDDCVIDASIDFYGNEPWLTGLSDTDYPDYTNWIRSGILSHEEGVPMDFSGIDDHECFENVLGGTWAPYRLVSNVNSFSNGDYLAVGWDSFRAHTRIDDLASVNLVITPDKSKWTRSPVIETGPIAQLNQGGREPQYLRDHPSVDKFGIEDGSGTYGMSWFPGYAINLETGERLNIMFGENSSMTDNNGRDLVWNPTSMVESNGYPVIGGGHYIYIMGHNAAGDPERMPLYDEGQFIYNGLSMNGFNPTPTTMIPVYVDAMWVTPPLLIEGHSLLESEVVVRLRVKKPYDQYETTLAPINATNPLYCFNASQVSTDVDDIELEEDLLIFPNPSKGQFIVQHSTLQSIKLYGTDGRLVFTDHPILPIGQVDISDQPAGIYFVIVETDNGFITRKYVKR